MYHPTEVHIQVKWLQHDVYITCETNLRGVDTYNLITPHSTKSIRCVDDACGIKINHPDSGDYQCEVKLDGYSITSLKQTILDFSDSPPTQWMITARAPTINITAIGVGAAGVLLVIILTTVFSITIGILCYKVRQNGYQPLPNHDPGERSQYSVNIQFHVQQHHTYSVRTSA